jgi:hypothetical protein
MRRYYYDDELPELLAEELINRRNGGRRRRMTPGVRRELLRELQAVRALEDRLARSRHPEVRETLVELLKGSRDQDLTTGELIDLLNNKRGTSLPDYFDTRGVLITAGVLATLLAIPSVREKVRLLLKKAIMEAMEFGDKFKTFAASLGEDLEDIIAEASFNKLKDSMEPEKGE